MGMGRVAGVGGGWFEGREEFNGAVQSLVAHVVVEGCGDIRLHCTWKDKLFHSATVLSLCRVRCPLVVLDVLL